MFTQVLVQVVNITRKNVYQTDLFIYQSYFTKKVKKLLKWLLMKMCVSKKMWKLDRCVSGEM